MIAATAPTGELLPSNRTSTADANRIVAMVMPDTGLLDEPTRPARYADTETNRKPATIMMTVIGTLTPQFCTMAWYRASSGKVNNTSATSIHFIGRSRSVSGRLASVPLRAAAMPLFTPDSRDLRNENSVHTPPINMAPTPR